MKSQESIPASKVQRATAFVKTGVKVGGNYVKHYAKKAVNPEKSKDDLHNDNAEEIYGMLSNLKGSALKVAQMMSMDQNILPTAYQERFAMSQYSAPPLSGPLIVKTFKSYFGKSPSDIFDTFTKEAVNAASIGQVHKASKDGKEFAVKVQYPGVAESVQSDLKMAKPFAKRLMNVKGKDLDKYMNEVEERLTEETDYELELKRSVEISEACKDIGDVVFPKYYPEFSARKILTMDWIDGAHIKEWLLTNPDQIMRNKVGQIMWDFYDYQVHKLKMVHADPHPGNFMITKEGKLAILDFGCVKVIPEEFYINYFKLLRADRLTGNEEFEKILEDIELITSKDSQKIRNLFVEIYAELGDLLSKPYRSEKFDFGDNSYFKDIYDLGEKTATMKELREAGTARGSQHALYVNRTYFGLYNLLNQIKAEIEPRTHWEF
ncbi:AarF/ABC1/UbiB kinase family protein [Hyphobacterium sp. CCMP332]|nr:AarF/ABC1/UbiB kinase family protein [Hyphobacterium sp. CCMP332]